MTSNIDQFKSLCTYVKVRYSGEICGYFGNFIVLSTYAYSKIITIYYPSKVGWTYITYSLSNEYEKAYNKLNEVILILKQFQLNEKLERIKDDF
jgi:hypothetical protein